MPFFIKPPVESLGVSTPKPDAAWLAFLDNAPTMIWVSDLRGRFIHVNNTWQKATGMNLADYQGDAIWEIVHPVDRVRLAAAAAAFKGDTMSNEYRLLQADGSYRWVNEYVRGWRDEQGRLLGFIGSVNDIQGQRDQEQYLAIIAMRQTSLTYFSRLVVEVGSPEQINQEALRLFCEHLAVPAAVLVLQDEQANVLQLVSSIGLDPAGAPPQLAEMIASGDTLDYPEDADGFPIVHAWMSAQGWSEGVAVPIDPQAPQMGWIIGLRSAPNQAPIGPLHYARDLVSILAISHARHRTQRKLLEGEERALQLQKMEAVGLLAGGVAHDFNNLLTAIRCFAELLRDDIEVPEQRARLDDILHASSRASHLVRQLVSFSRQEVSQPEPIDLNTLVDSLRGFIRSVLSEHIRIDIDLCSCAAWCLVDAKQLEQVIFNLCLNARDVMHTDGVLGLRVTCSDQATEGGRRVRLSVSDTGCGIPVEVRAKLFQPFHTTKAPGRGTGLGLATSLGIVRAFGGDLTYDTELGKGTVFHIDLPEIADPLAAYDEDAAAVKTTESVRILLVEDDDLVRAVTQMLATSLGHQVTVYSDSREACAWAEQTGLDAIDLLVTDIIMPGMDGHELSRKLRLIKPSLKVFYMSGYVDDPATIEAMSQPGIFFLSKPFTSDEFTRKLAAALDSGA
jgi:two-component system, cell cycle sensor histidine kinase and response regulator CckA